MITDVPWPGPLAMEICPWCSSTIFFTEASPKPVPARLVVKNGSNTFPTCSIGIGAPSFWMVI